MPPKERRLDDSTLTGPYNLEPLLKRDQLKDAREIKLPVDTDIPAKKLPTEVKGVPQKPWSQILADAELEDK